MKTYAFSVIASAFLLLSCRATFPENYQVQCFNTSADATYTVDVYYQANKSYTDVDRIKLSAVDGVLFRGLTGGKGCTAQKPLLIQSKAAVSNTAFFKMLYGKKKSYDKYITLLQQGPQELIETNGKKQLFTNHYQVTVNKELLRKDLIAEGLLKPLNSGF